MAWGVGSCPVSLPLPRRSRVLAQGPAFASVPFQPYLLRVHLYPGPPAAEPALKRYRAYDPPEYFDWEADPTEVARFSDVLRREPTRWARIKELSTAELLAMYRDLLVTRLQDIGLKRWVRTGVISKAWLGTGEEAATVGTVTALDRDHDVVSPMIRNAGALHMMGMSLEDGFRGYLGTEDSPNGGRDLHIGALDKGVLQPVSHMGTSITVVAGIALAFKSRKEKRVAVGWVGDGATKSAACHEGLIVAARMRVPAIFIIQNNQVALGTRVDKHGAGDITTWPAAYGMDSLTADGNNVLDVFAAVTEARRRCVAGAGPVAVVLNTFRMGGHATHDEREARETFPGELFETWGKRDPIGLFEEYLKGEGIEVATLAEIEEAATNEVEAAAENAKASKERIPDPSHAIYDGFTEGGVLHGLQHRLDESKP